MSLSTLAPWSGSESEKETHWWQIIGNLAEIQDWGGILTSKDRNRTSGWEQAAEATYVFSEGVSCSSDCTSG